MIDPDRPPINRMSGWRESASWNVRELTGMPIADARELVERVFTAIEDVDYLVLVDCHYVPEGMHEYSIDDKTYTWDGKPT